MKRFGTSALVTVLVSLAIFATSRVFHYQFGIWQMAESYHNTIQAGGVMNEVQGH